MNRQCVVSFNIPNQSLDRRLDKARTIFRQENALKIKNIKWPCCVERRIDFCCLKNASLSRSRKSILRMENIKLMGINVFTLSRVHFSEKLEAIKTNYFVLVYGYWDLQLLLCTATKSEIRTDFLWKQTKLRWKIIQRSSRFFPKKIFSKWLSLVFWHKLLFFIFAMKLTCCFVQADVSTLNGGWGCCHLKQSTKSSTKKVLTQKKFNSRSNVF